MGCGSSTTVETISISQDNKSHQKQKTDSPSKTQPNNSGHPNSTTPDENFNQQHEPIVSGHTANGASYPDDDKGETPDYIDDGVHPPGNSNTNFLANGNTADDPNDASNEEESSHDGGSETTLNAGDGRFSHDNLQKETFLTGNYTHQENGGVEEQEESTESLTREEKHERRAKLIERQRAQYDYKVYEDPTKNLDSELAPLVFPKDPLPDQTTGAHLTVLDITKHNSDMGMKDWFKYARKVYSWAKMEPIIESRVEQCKLAFWCMEYSHPVLHVRSRGISREELPRVLAACYVGECKDLPSNEIVDNMKQDITNILTTSDEHNEDFVDDLGEDTNGENLQAYKDVLCRWLNKYPNCVLLNTAPDPGEDPNSLPFPLPPNIQEDPLVLRNWIEEFSWDTELEGDGFFHNETFIYKDVGEEHDLFANSVASHVDNMIPDLDLSIDGEVAWQQIELYLLKNDVTTDQQNEILDARSKRSNLNDEEWQTSRREILAQALTTRHEWQPEKMGPFVGMCDRLKLAWADLENLCQTDFEIPEKFRKRINNTSKKDNSDNKHSTDGNHSGLPDTKIDKSEDVLSAGNPLEEDNTFAPTTDREETQENIPDAFGNDDKADSGLEMDNPMETDADITSITDRRGSGDGQESANSKKQDDFFD